MRIKYFRLVKLSVLVERVIGLKGKVLNELQIETVQYVYDSVFEKEWKSYYLSLVKNELNHLLTGEQAQHEEDSDLCT